MNSRAWKQSESDMALALGGRRVPITGRARGESPDIEHTTWAIEHKAGRVLPARLTLAWEQARAAAAGTTKTPLVTIDHRPGPGQPRQCYVMMRLEDFVAWMVEQQEATE
jgi:hypothetical protein